MIIALTQGMTQEAAARTVGVTSKTIRRKLADPRFTAKLRAAQDRIYEHAAGKLASLMTCAADTLGELLSEDNPSIRLRAAQVLLDSGLRFREHLELADRIAALEERQGAQE